MPHHMMHVKLKPEEGASHTTNHEQQANLVWSNSTHVPSWTLVSGGKWQLLPEERHPHCVKHDTP